MGFLIGDNDYFVLCHGQAVKVAQGKQKDALKLRFFSYVHYEMYCVGLRGGCFISDEISREMKNVSLKT